MKSLSCKFNALRTLNSLYETLRTFVRLTRIMEESLQKVWQMTVAFLYWCYLPRKGIDLRLCT